MQTWNQPCYTSLLCKTRQNFHKFYPNLTCYRWKSWPMTWCLDNPYISFQSLKIHEWWKHNSNYHYHMLVCLLIDTSSQLYIALNNVQYRTWYLNTYKGYNSFNSLYRLRKIKHQSYTFLALFKGNSLVTCGFPSQRASHVDSVSICCSVLL